MTKWNNGPLMGIKRYTFHYGSVSPQAVNGPRVTKGLYGPKYVLGHTWAGSYNGLESYWTAQMKLLGLIPIGCDGLGVSGP